jgi:hypothetical protein
MPILAVFQLYDIQNLTKLFLYIHIILPKKIANQKKHTLLLIP